MIPELEYLVDPAIFIIVPLKYLRIFLLLDIKTTELNPVLNVAIIAIKSAFLFVHMKVSPDSTVDCPKFLFNKISDGVCKSNAINIIIPIMSKVLAEWR